ncbi:polysaccharide deacetylase family protein [Paenibacillus dakarensis]|uniref:polysaccharide deacetylase family protein n=1 Tax=Paenibacillus dakarensis TaxID=1527293 RepID=UPI0009EC41B5|nr:polysaccharide deacetylase family protein [Paenibacillus dakarensis]
MKKLYLPLVLVIASSLVSSPLDAKPYTSTKGREYYEQRGEIVWEVPTTNKVIALTFDDGPDDTSTANILDLLKQYDAKATFFVVGNRVERYPEIVKRELAEGHEIGNHSFSHPSFERINSQKMMTELAKTQEAILHATGHNTELFRPPGGSYNEAIVQHCRKSGLLMILWSWHQDTLDWRKPGVERIVNKVLKNAHNGDIVLMHDFVADSTQTYDALKIILPELKKRGYSFVTISDLLSYGKQTKNYMEVNH